MPYYRVVVDAGTGVLVRSRQRICAGQPLGRALDGRSLITAQEAGVVVGIRHDVDPRRLLVFVQIEKRAGVLDR